MRQELLEKLSSMDDWDMFKAECGKEGLDPMKAYEEVEAWWREPANRFVSRDLERCLSREYRPKEIPIAPKAEDRLVREAQKKGLRDARSLCDELENGKYRMLWRWCSYPGALTVLGRASARLGMEKDTLCEALGFRPEMSVRDAFAVAFPCSW